MVVNNGLSLRKKVNIEESVSSISLDWFSGEVKILASETDNVHIIQYGNNNFPEKKLAHTHVNSGVLSIVDGRKKGNLLGFNFQQALLEIYLPKKKIQSFTINGTGSHLFIQTLHTATAKIKLTSSRATISGNYDELELSAVGTTIVGEDADIGKLKLLATSSKADIDGKISNIDVNVIGRSAAISSKMVPKHIQSLSTGANVTVTIPDNEGFNFKFKKVSGHFKTDFALTSKDNSFTYKGGGEIYSAEVRGGKFSLQKEK